MKTRVFYLEDEPFLAKVVVETLEKKGYDVCHIDSGENALELYQNYDPDICILDVMVPIRDGFTIGKSIRKHTEHLPIIYLTAKVQAEDVIEGFKNGGTDYLRKPFSMEELVVRMEHQLNWSKGKQDDNKKFELGGFVFHPERQELLFGSRSLRLSYRESQLLNFLVRNREGIAVRKEILLQLWGDDSYFNSRNLDVYIKKLRDHLKEDASIRILTLKGVGYRLLVENK